MDHLLLEREEELELLDDVLDAARRGDGGLCVVRGAPGAGKTELLREAGSRATASGSTVLRARGSELEQGFAWGTTHALFATTSREPRDAATLALPVLGRPAGPVVVDRVARSSAADARFAVEHGLYWYVADLSDDAPVALVIDDAQWVDLASLSFLAYLAERLQGMRVALVVAARETVGGAHEVLLGRIERQPGARRCTPAPLSAPAVRELVSRRLGDEAARALADACHVQTHGNPFLTSELIAEVRRTAVPATAQGAEAVARLRPAAVGRSVASRLTGVDPRAAVLARAVAVLGRRTETWTAAAVAGLQVEEATVLADELTTVGLLAPARPLDFVHPLVEAAVRDEIPDGQRALLHQRAVDVLVAGGAEPWMVAPHLVRTEPRGDAATAEVLRAAAASAMDGGDPESAVALLRRALRETWTGPRDPELLEALGRALLSVGDPEGLEHLDAARRRAPTPGVRAAIGLTVALARYERGEPREAQSAIAAGLAEPLDSDDPVRVSLSAADLTVRRSLTDGGQGPGPDTARAALAVFGEAHSPVERLRLAQLAFQGLQTGALQRDEVVALASRAVNVPDGDRPDRLDDLARPLAGMALYFSDVCAPAEAAFTAAVDRAQRSGARLEWATAAFFRGASRFLRGDLPGAADDFDVALDAADVGWAFALPSSRALRALVAVDRDEPELIVPLLELPGGDDPWRTHPTFPYVLSMRGVHLTTQGRPEDGLAALLEAGALQEALGIRNPAPMHWQAEAAVAAHAAGHLDQATELGLEVLDRARRYNAARPIGIALRALAATTTGDEAHALLLDSEQVLAASPARLEHAKSLLALGSLQRRMGRRITARETLRRALDLADRCGAPAVARSAAEELRVAGGRPRRERTSGVGSLTSSERRVAVLAAEGRTNREIAQALFVALRTVEAHLTRTYAKLDVDRRGLAAVLRTAD